jgi:hypothetical protein
MLVPMGMTYQIKQLGDGSGFGWRLMRFKKEIGSGMDRTEAGARRKVTEKIMEFSESEAPRLRARSAAVQMIKYMMDRRPHLVAGVIGQILSGAVLRDVIEQAEDQERMMHDSEPKKLRVPIPTHHRTKPASQAAAQFVDYLRTLGLFGEDTPSPKLAAWAKKMGLVRQEI